MQSHRLLLQVKNNTGHMVTEGVPDQVYWAVTGQQEAAVWCQSKVLAIAATESDAPPPETWEYPITTVPLALESEEADPHVVANHLGMALFEQDEEALTWLAKNVSGYRLAAA